MCAWIDLEAGELSITLGDSQDFDVLSLENITNALAAPLLTHCLHVI